MTIRLNKVTRDLNVGITTAVEFLQKKGFTVEANPNTKITDEQFELLKKEFSTDKDLKIKSERFSQERQSKDRNKASVSIDGYKETQEKAKPEEIKTVVPEDVRPKFKPVGKIDLDKLNRRPAPAQEKEKETEKAIEEKKVEEPAVVETPKPEPAPQPEIQPASEPELQSVSEPQPQPVVKEEPAPVSEAQQESKKEEMIEAPAPTPAAEEAPVEKEGKEEGEEIFKIHQPEFVSKINVIGQIDLAALNQSTRPKKKSKEEKRKEREEKEKIRQDQKKQMKEAIIKEIRRDDSKLKDTAAGDANGKKKRVRINKEKVDINNASNFQRGGNDRGHAGAQQGQGGRPQGGNQPGGNNANNNRNRNKDRFKKPVIKQEVSEEDVAKQVKETLARLTSKGKNKGAKYRKEKRDMASSRMQELEDMEMAESKVLKITEFVTANELASMMDVSVTQVIATCMSIGMMVSINQRLDAETINLVAEEFGFKTEYVSAEVAQAIVEEEDDEEEETGMNSKIEKLVIVLAAVVGAIILISIVVFVVKSSGLFKSGKSTTQSTIAATTEAKHHNTTEKYTVDNYIGLSLEAAREAIDNKFKINVTEEYSDTYAKGLVMQQDPESDTELEEGKTIKLVVSKGQKIEDKVTVPDVRSKTKSGAQSELKAAGLKVSIKESYSDDVAKGEVISQTPSQGSKVSKNTTVVITVSKGKKEDQTVSVPNLRYYTESEASQELQRFGLSLGSVLTEYSDSVEKGLVIRQRISSGSKVKKGTAVGIYVSLGPRQTATTADEESTTTGEE